jgi:recombinational DNA repair protein RecT
MAKKTVLKSLLKNFGILSIELKHAVKFDQSAPEIGKSIEAAEPLYLDTPGDTYTEYEPVVFNEDHAEFESAKHSFQAGHVTIEQLSKKYAINKKELKELFTKI